MFLLGHIPADSVTESWSSCSSRVSVYLSVCSQGKHAPALWCSQGPHETVSFDAVMDVYLGVQLLGTGRNLPRNVTDLTKMLENLQLCHLAQNSEIPSVWNFYAKACCGKHLELDQGLFVECFITLSSFKVVRPNDISMKLTQSDQTNVEGLLCICFWFHLLPA